MLISQLSILGAMNNQSVPFLHKIEGYYLIPHELLHVLAYRLIGKPCHYRWGDHQVYSSAPKTKREELFVLLLPALICWLFAFLFGVSWLLSAFFIRMPPERYFIDGPTWHFVFPIIASLSMLYSGTAYRDIRWVLRILFGNDKTQDDRPEPHQQAKKE
jgi:hypothetical protein